MAEKNRTELKAYFETGDRPTQGHFIDLIDSAVNKSQDKANLTEALSTNDTKYITPKTANHIVDNAVPNATISTKGKVELATLTEVTAGTDSTRAVTPEGAKRAAEVHAPVTSVNGQTGSIVIGNDSGWTVPLLQNGFLNYNASWYEAVRYRKKDGVVYMEGLVKAGATNVVLFQLPSGFRPSKRMMLSNISYDATVYSPARIDITSGGNVYIVTDPGEFTSLSGLSFLVD
ncbi:hypothetical protein H2O64_17980 [Kordia sp. YSTF-M3]|uniref:Uncharacterized protein n=1 Tax=Kordia aestuariivivens TaxID=2759037 RepID=A0ABR7QDD5_9FLAO|nr:hypothetical protein [Kordia aestuariivivens]MBC8756566.1 hypothetical protein [Kordia aestuariivivens]